MGHSLIWPIRVCAAEQGNMVFKVLSLLTLHQDAPCTLFKNGVSFWTGSLSKSVKTCDERSILAIPIIFFLNIYFHDFSVKNYLILYAKQNKSGSKSSVSCLKQSGEMSNFCLKQSRGLKALATHLYPNFL